MSERLEQIGHQLATQDNRLTQNPIFVVERKRRIYGADDADRFEWRDEDWAVVTGAQADELERNWDYFGEKPKEFTRVAWVEVYEFVTACFTEQGCKDYIALDGHNLGEHRIYVHGAYRNQEWQDVRNHLLSMAPAATPTP